MWYFSNLSGVGFNRGRDDGWIEHQDTFNQILAELNSARGEGVCTIAHTVWHEILAEKLIWRIDRWVLSEVLTEKLIGVRIGGRI